MQHKSKLFYNIIALFIIGFFGWYYLEKLVLPNLMGYNDLYVFNGDSTIYHNHSNEESLVELSSPSGILHSIGTSNLLGMAFTVWLAKLVSEDNWQYAIFALNLILLFATIRNYELIFRYFNSKQYPLFLFLFCLNPLLIVGLANISKEIWGLFFVSAFLRYRISKSYFRYFMATILSFFIRDIFSVIGILFFLMTTMKVNKFLYIFAISVLIPYVMSDNMVDLLIEGQDQDSLGIAVFLNTIQSYPCGYLITYFPKLLISAFADLSPLRLLKGSDNIIGNFTTGSALLAFIFSIKIFNRIFLHKYRVQPVLAHFFFAYTFVVTVTAFIHHRYLFPLYPVLSLMFLLTFSYKQETASISSIKFI